MKFKKKTAMIISLAVGTMMFATTALAEVSSKDGYEQLKDSIKYTAESCSSKLNNYTLNLSCMLKDNDTVISSQDDVIKLDIKNNSKEDTNNNMDLVGGNRKSFYYTDKNCYITYNSDQDLYYESDYTTAKNTPIFTNPFKEDKAGDVERIADAIIGNLKDSVIVNQNSDGSKEISGSLSEAQIPSLINALVSFEFRSSFNGYSSARVGAAVDSSSIIKITKDIFVKEVKGKMLVDKNGLIQSVLASGVLCGKDKDGSEHNLSFEVLGKLTDINSTTVSKPDLSGRKVEKTTVHDRNQVSNIEEYVGQYKNDIIMEKDGKFQKIGERIIDIAGIDNKNIEGRYHEEYIKGYEQYASNAKDFRFDATFKDFPYGASFEYTNAAGKKYQGSMGLNVDSATIFFNVENNSAGSFKYDTNFHRVFN